MADRKNKIDFHEIHFLKFRLKHIEIYNFININDEMELMIQGEYFGCLASYFLKQG